MENLLGLMSVTGAIAGTSYLATSLIAALVVSVGAIALIPVGLAVGTIFAVGGRR
jgi:hypothetical protein